MFYSLPASICPTCHGSIMTTQLIRQVPHGPFCLCLNERSLKGGVCQSLSASSPSHCTSAQVFVLANFHYAEIGQVYVCTGDFITVRLLSQPHVTHTQRRGMCSWRHPLDPPCFSISISTEKEICIRHRSAREEKPRQRTEEFYFSFFM